MRISGIENYIGGADNVKALSLIQGEQRVLQGVILNPDGTAMDITTFAITAKTEFYLADVTATPRKMTITNLTKHATAKDHTIPGVKINNAEGTFSITIPADFYVTSGDAQIAIDTDLAVNVPLAVVYIDYNVDSGVAASAVRSSRIVITMRRGSPSVGL